jgi:hypothetical protein
MTQVSKRFAKKVKTYGTGGALVRSAEGRGITRSQKSLALGKQLSRKNLTRVNRLEIG